MSHAWRVVVLLIVTATALSGCLWKPSSDGGGASTTAPDVGACRVLTPADVGRPANDTTPEPCTQPHTAQTYAVDSLPTEFAHAAYGDPDVASYAYRTCTQQFRDFTGADESTSMRTLLSWAWFRPSTAAWDHGARWFRCDVIGGGAQSKTYLDLPTTTQDLLTGRPKDAWMVCAQGATVDGSVKVPCTEKHDWRAVTTIVLGDDSAPYPGDAAVQARSKDFCSKSVGAWLDYPVDYDFGYSWFQQPEWDAGNRRSVCWARTDS